MPFNLDSPAPMVRLLRRIVEILAADTELSAVLGDRITAAGPSEYASRIQTPALLVLPTKGDPQDNTSGNSNLAATFAARVILPRETPSSSFVPVPSAPTVAAPGSSITYRLTQITTAGESYASPPVTASGITTLTLPAFDTGGRAFRIWRSAAGRKTCRWIGTAYEAGAWTDSATRAMGAEIAPVFGLHWQLRGLIEAALKNYDEDRDQLPTGSEFLARRCSIGPFEIGLMRTNQLSLSLALTYPTTYNPATQTLKTYAS